MAIRPKPAQSKRASILEGLRFDARRAGAMARKRVRLLKDLNIEGRVPQDGNMPPWLYLDAMNPSVAGKGWLEFHNVHEVGRRWDTQVPVATFHGLYREELPSSSAIIRPTAIVHIDPPGQFLVELSVWGNCIDQPQTAFRVFAAQEAVITVDKAKDDLIAVIATGSVSLHLDIPHDGQVTKRGAWALNSVKVTPL
jgi:hypothetical protein